MRLNVFWFRRDLRLYDNHGLFRALSAGLPVLPIFIFDPGILEHLEADDARVSFIHETLQKINSKLENFGSGLLVRHGEPLKIWKELIGQFEINEVFLNHDYEPYAIERDAQVEKFLTDSGIKTNSFKDQVTFEKNEILKSDGKPYTVYTPYKNKWIERLRNEGELPYYRSEDHSDSFIKQSFDFPELSDLGFEKSNISVKALEKANIPNYDKHRDIPFLNATTFSGLYLRFGTVSPRALMRIALKNNQVYASELIWREFFMMILWHFPHVVHKSFKPQYDNISWLNDEVNFQAWCKGKTGYPLVDAGMRELNQSGYMHNRVRMVTASFLCKHLLIDWRWGEAYFANKLLDFELASNNGNWQWAAGCGCDAAPYFRVFNPELQLQKFDSELKYVKKWVPEYGTPDYPKPIVDHKFARERAIHTYKTGINS